MNPLLRALIGPRHTPKRESESKSIAWAGSIQSWEEGKGVDADYDSLSAIDLYRKSPAIYAGVYAIASAIAMLPLRVYHKVGKDEIELPGHPLEMLLNNPSRHVAGINQRFGLIAMLELTGNAYLLLEGGNADAGGPPDTMTLLLSQFVKPIPDAESHVGGFFYQPKGEKVHLTREQVIDFSYFSPTNYFVGQSSIEAALLAATADLWAQAFNSSFFKRGAVLSGTLETEFELSPEVMSRLVQDFRQQHGGGDRAWDVKGLSHGLKFKGAQQTHHDMGFNELRTAARGEMLMSIGTPPVMVTQLDGATYANAKEQKSQFWQLTALPRARMVEEVLTQQLARRYGPDLFVRFDTASVSALRDDLTSMVAALVQMIPNGIITRNEARQFLSTGELPKLNPLKGGDEPLLSMALAPATDGGDDAESVPPSPEANDTESSVPPSEAESIDLMLSTMEAQAKKIQREAIYRSFESDVRPWMRVMLHTAKVMFAEQEALVMSSYGKAFSEVEKGHREVAALIDSTNTRNVQRFRTAYERVIRAGGKRALRRVGGKPPDAFSLVSPNAIKFMEKNAAELVKNVAKVTKDKLRDAIAEGVLNRENEIQIATRLREVFDMTRERANTISRTETMRSFNFGGIEGYKQSGVVESKQWVSTIDATARENHMDIDGLEASLDEPFRFKTAGGEAIEMEYPLDPSAPAGETVNCRCTVVPVVKSEAEITEGEE